MFQRLTLTLLTLMLTTGPALAGDTLHVQKMLSRPGVRLVVVEFYATWCKPCMEAIPRWNALHKKYYDQGLRLIVVNTQDPNGLCGAPGWTPDDMVCDMEGYLANNFGATDLPAAYLWSWQGNLLVQRGHVDKVEKAIEDYFLKNPRIVVEATNAKGEPSDFLRDLVRNEFSKQGKFTVVASADERAMAAKIRKESFQSNYSRAGRCKLGEEVSANSIVKVSLQRERLNLQLFSAEKSCLVQAASVRYSRKNPGRSAAEVVDKLLGQAALPEIVLPGPSGARTVEEPKKQGAQEDRLWALIKDSTDARDFDDYLQQFPEGRYAMEARVLKRRAESGGGSSSFSQPTRRSQKDEYAETLSQCSDGPSCTSLGYNYSNGRGVAKDFKRANALYEKACKLNYGMGCSNLGGSYRDGLGVAKDFKRANALYEKACELKHGTGCTSLGYNYANGRGVTKDFKRANALYEKACELKHGTGCSNLGGSYRDGLGVAKDFKRANALYEKACELKHGTGCTSLGYNYANGRGVTKDIKRANALYEKACELMHGTGCSNLGVNYSKGLGVAKDLKRAYVLYEKACELGYQAACGKRAE